MKWMKSKKYQNFFTKSKKTITLLDIHINWCDMRISIQKHHIKFVYPSSHISYQIDYFQSWLLNYTFLWLKVDRISTFFNIIVICELGYTNLIWCFWIDICISHQFWCISDRVIVFLLFVKNLRFFLLFFLKKLFKNHKSIILYFPWYLLCIIHQCVYDKYLSIFCNVWIDILILGMLATIPWLQFYYDYVYVYI